MKANTFTIIILILFLASSCQKDKLFKINDVWKKIDVTNNPIDKEQEIWDMKNGNLSILSRLKDGNYENKNGGKYFIKSALGSTFLIVENCPNEKYNGEWTVVELNTDYMVICMRTNDGLQYLEFEQAK